MEKVPVIWTETSRQQLHNIYLYLAEDSILQTDRIFDLIVNSTIKLAIHPYRNPPDKYKTDNDGNYRAYELRHFRISYKIIENAIYIIRIRSTYQNPEEY